MSKFIEVLIPAVNDLNPQPLGVIYSERVCIARVELKQSQEWDEDLLINLI